MSSGVYALMGVLLGGVVTLGVSWFQAWRSRRSEWLVAARLLADELERLMVDLGMVIRTGVVPARQGEGFLDTSAWDTYSTVIARELPNNAAGDAFWRELSRIHSAIAHHVRPWLGEQPPGAPFEAGFTDPLRQLFDGVGAAYKELTGSKSQMQLETGAQTGAQGG
jgi:hypothetical protein